MVEVWKQNHVRTVRRMFNNAHNKPNLLKSRKQDFHDLLNMHIVVQFFSEHCCSFKYGIYITINWELNHKCLKHLKCHVAEFSLLVKIYTEMKDPSEI